MISNIETIRNYHDHCIITDNENILDFDVYYYDEYIKRIKYVHNKTNEKYYRIEGNRTEIIQKRTFNLIYNYIIDKK